MALPKIKQPLFEATIPSTKKKITFRPFLVKEEKILLIAQQSGNDGDIVRSIKQILNNCVIDSDFNVDSLATFDLEYLFLKLRSKSVNNIAKLSYRDNNDGQVYDFELDLDTVEVTFSEKNNPNIKITDTVGMSMKYPSATITDNISEFENEIDLMTFFIRNCIDTIYDEENVYVASEYSEEELDEFLDSLDVSTFERIREFFETMPKLYHKIDYKNSLGEDREIELTNLKDFFMWG